MWAWLVSLFISKAVPTVKHALWRTISVVCVLLVVGVVVLGAYRIINPKPTHTQVGGVSYNYEIKLGFGSCARIPSPMEIKK